MSQNAGGEPWSLTSTGIVTLCNFLTIDYSTLYFGSLLCHYVAFFLPPHLPIRYCMFAFGFFISQKYTFLPKVIFFSDGLLNNSKFERQLKNASNDSYRF